MKRQQAGFTLIELVVVIIILGILAAVALPKFMGLSTDARVSVVNGLNGSVAEAADMVHALVEVNNTPTGGTLTLADGTAIKTQYGYPDTSSSGILLALQDATTAPSQSFPFTLVSTTTTATFEYTPPKGVANTSCEVVYTLNKPVAPATVGSVSVLPTTGGC
ncbi:MAG: type II secretion system protein [Acidiferrobacter sp.]